MPGKMIGLFLLVLLVGCAHPNYQDDATNTNQSENNFNQPCGLKFDQAHLCGQITWEKQQTEDEMGSFLIQFGILDSDNHLTPQTPPAALAVILWMPSMGHGSSPVSLTPLSTGLYRVSNVWFSMRGDWLIQVQFKNQTAVLDEASQTFHF
jgi:hypothetical protein